MVRYVGCLACLVCVFLVGACSKHPSPTQTAAPSPSFQPPASEPTAAPAVEITAVKLWQAYHDNPVGADARYKGKRLFISGIIDKIDQDISGKPFLYLKSPDLIMQVPVRFRGDEAAALSDLQPGSAFSAVCTCRGRSLGSPDLIDCVPEPAKP